MQRSGNSVKWRGAKGYVVWAKYCGRGGGTHAQYWGAFALPDLQSSFGGFQDRVGDGNGYDDDGNGCDVDDDDDEYDGDGEGGGDDDNDEGNANQHGYDDGVGDVDGDDDYDDVNGDEDDAGGMIRMLKLMTLSMMTAK